jgi:Protein of unknown function (DUF2785)
MMHLMHPAALIGLFIGLLSAPANGQPALPRDRDAWIALAKSGFTLPTGQDAGDVLLAMNPLLASTDPVLRDDVAYTAAERWILRDKVVPADALRTLMTQWTSNLDNGLGQSGDDRVFGRSFSALCLSVSAAADLSAPFLGPSEVEQLFARLLDYFARETDLRGFDSVRGWMHTVAHTSDALKFLARNPKLGAGVDRRLLAAVQAKIEATDAVFAWGENDRMALALQSAVRRPDADAAALEAWTARWVEAHRALWAKGPHVNPRAFAQAENAKQVMRSLHAALSMEASPTPNGTAAAKTVLAALAKMR